MDTQKNVNILKWIILFFVLIIIAIIGRLSEYRVDLLTQSICPEGWWHTGLNWKHCAFPPISIAKHVTMYVGFSILSLFLIHLIHPKPIAAAVLCLLLILIVAPIVWLVTVGFSWIVFLCLCSVLLLGLVYRMGMLLIESKNA